MTIEVATPDRTGGTSLSKYEDVETGHWFRTLDGTWGPGIMQEVVDLEWNPGRGGAVVYLRNEGERDVHATAFRGWRDQVRPTLPPWAE